MKKKPAPGATLIARLKEKRLQREAVEEANEERSLQDSIVVDLAEDEYVRLENQKDSEPEKLALKELKVSDEDFLYRQINIEDLKPQTNDYEALTEEIKLAGRFAAIGLIAQGLRLACIHNSEIHKVQYATFEDYCRSEHKMSATYAYRLIRMAELAEKIAERSKKSSIGNKTCPFETMLNLGHRHLMALLPLSEDLIEEYLTEGLPLVDPQDVHDKSSISQDKPKDIVRIPIAKATEKQIRLALRKEETQLKKLALPLIDKSLEDTIMHDIEKIIFSMENLLSILSSCSDDLKLAKLKKEELFRPLSDKFVSTSNKIIELLDETNAQ